MSRPTTRAMILALALQVCLSCNNTNNVDIAVVVLDNQKAPIPAASVILDGQTVGQTNNSGTLNLTKEFPINTRVKVEIQKQSSDFYYAPFFDSFFVNNKESSSINLSATLYSVPKPSAADDQQVNAPAATTNEINQPVVDTKEDSQAKSKETSALDKSPTVIAENDVIPNDKKAITGKVISASEEDINDLEAEEITQKADALPIPPINKANQTSQPSTVFTIFAYDKDQPIADVSVSYGLKKHGTLRKGCKTNLRGRCVIHFKVHPKEPVSFHASKPGHRTSAQTVRVQNKGKLRLQLPQGQVLNIHALTKRSNYTKGLSGVEVFVQGTKQGLTDDFGRFAYTYTGKKGELLEIILKPSNHLPYEFSTDFVVSGDMELIKHFTQVAPPVVKLGILPTQVSGNYTGKINERLAKVDASLSKALQANLFTNSLFARVPQSLLNQEITNSGSSPLSITQIGWHSKAMEHQIDALIKPTLVISANGKSSLELAIVDSKTRILSAAKAEITKTRDQGAVFAATTKISRSLILNYPFEGAIMEKDGSNIRLNIGSKGGRNLKIGTQLDIYGTQSDKFGRKRQYRKVATATINKISLDSSQAQVGKLLPRATFAEGDLVVVSPKRSEKPKTRKPSDLAVLKLISQQNGSPTPVAGANIYYENSWLGTSDDQGKITVDTRELKKHGIIKVVKAGYEEFIGSLSKLSRNKYQINLAKRFALVAIESDPAGATVLLGGQRVGKTPLKEAIKTKSGFIKLELTDLPGYKSFSTILELDEGKLDLTGAQAIKLERDLIEPVELAVNRGDLETAIKKLSAIPPYHSDYITGQNLAGEIYLTMLNQPHKAAAAYAEVTKRPEIKNFNDKRFISSHINEGIAVFLTGESFLESSPKSAAAHYAKAREILERVIPQMRFINPEENAQAQINIAYYRSLALQRLWSIDKDPALLAQVFNSWQRFLDSENPQNKDNQLFHDARTYLKQAKSLLAQKTPNKKI